MRHRLMSIGDYGRLSWMVFFKVTATTANRRYKLGSIFHVFNIEGSESSFSQSVHVLTKKQQWIKLINTAYHTSEQKAINVV